MEAINHYLDLRFGLSVQASAKRLVVHLPTLACSKMAPRSPTHFLLTSRSFLRMLNAFTYFAQGEREH